MINENLFWNSTAEEMKQGYRYDSNAETNQCLACGAEFKKGFIYTHNEALVDWDQAIRKHIESSHGSPFDCLVNLDKKYNGLSDTQKEIVKLMYDGLSDNEIAKKLDNKSSSTIRNHRFILREKYKEARVFTAMMELFENRSKSESQFVNFPAHIPTQDGRIMTTEKEKAGILAQYFDDEKLLDFPKKQKKKLIILQHISRLIDKERTYTEMEINGVLRQVYDDYVTIRRYLIEYGFLERLSDGSKYWAKKE